MLSGGRNVARAGHGGRAARKPVREEDSMALVDLELDLSPEEQAVRDTVHKFAAEVMRLFCENAIRLGTPKPRMMPTIMIVIMSSYSVKPSCDLLSMHAIYCL